MSNGMYEDLHDKAGHFKSHCSVCEDGGQKLHP